MKPILKFSLPLLITAALSFAPGLQKAAAAPTDWTRYPLIAHALGGIDGVDYTNSLQAFVQNYDKGQRVFELDLTLTEDGRLAVRHDWMGYLATKLEQDIPSDKMDVPLTMKEFKSYKILKKYTPLSFYDVAVLLKRYPDVYVITDTKETDPVLIKKQFTLIRDMVKMVDPSIIKRLIPEIYTPEMMEIVKEIIPFKHVIFSIYLSPMEPNEIVKYVKEQKIHVVAMPVERVESSFIKNLNRVGAVSYVHSINEVSEVDQLMDMGVHGVYTDFLSYKDLGIDPAPLYAAGKTKTNAAAGAGGNAAAKASLNAATGTGAVSQIQNSDAAAPSAAASANTPVTEQDIPKNIWESLKVLFNELITAII